jgi:hypothetical protein
MIIGEDSANFSDLVKTSNILSDKTMFIDSWWVHPNKSTVYTLPVGVGKSTILVCNFLV